MTTISPRCVKVYVLFMISIRVRAGFGAVLSTEHTRDRHALDGIMSMYRPRARCILSCWEAITAARFLQADGSRKHASLFPSRFYIQRG